MTGYINVICESFLISTAMMYFLVDDCKDKSRGFFIYLIIELLNNYVLFRILWMTEIGIALPQVIVWRIVLYAVYMTFRLGWFQVFVKDPYRQFLLIYFYLWVSTYTVVAPILFGGMHIILPERLAADAMSTMPKTYLGLAFHLICSLVVILAAVWIKKRNWIQRLSTNFLCILFAFVFILADVGSTFLLAKPYMESITYIQIALVNVIFLLAATYFGYINYLKMSARQENEKIQKIIETQFRIYEALSRKENEIRRIRHDLANHLQIIRKMAEDEKESFSLRYQRQLRDMYEEVCRNNMPEIYREKRMKRISRSAAWGIFTVFGVDALMVIVVSQLVLYKVFSYESIIIMQFALILFITLYVWLTFRRTRKENEELSQKINDSMESPDITRLMEYLDEIINSLESVSVWKEEQVLKRLDSVKFAVVTGNQILDSMLWHKKNMCGELGIDFEIEWNLPEDMRMEDMDVIGLMGNLLDNAIEACCRVEGKERVIQIKSRKHANITSIRVRNTKNESEEPIKKQFRTIKKDAENHGIGMKIIQSIVNKYNGMIQYYDEKTEFTVIVNLQVD